MKYKYLSIIFKDGTRIVAITEISVAEAETALQATWWRIADKTDVVYFRTADVARLEWRDKPRPAKLK